MGIIGLWLAVSPAVTIEPGVSMNPKDAFETRFYAQNQRPYTIRNWHYYCQLRVPTEANLPHRLTWARVDINRYDRLGPFAKSSLLCDQQYIDGKTTEHALMAISVAYDLPYIGKEVTDSTVFFLKRDADGNAYWLPVDGGRGLGDVMLFLKSMQIP